MQNILIIGNWKMQLSLKEGRELAREIDEEVPKEGVVVVLCPPFTHLAAIRSQISRAALGAQDMFWESKGAYTGEISPQTLKEVGCEYVIIGHSERRRYLQETDTMIQKKVRTALAQGLKPILCIGEKAEERERGKTLEVIEKQLNLDLAGIPAIDGLVVAYEPIWAIGTDKTPAASDIDRTAHYIRQLLGKMYDPKIASKVRILYGGSVEESNIGGFIQGKDINGFLVGGASIRADEFIPVIKKCSMPS